MLYKNGDILKKHKYSFSCEISGTLNLGGDMWPIYLENTKGKEINKGIKFRAGHYRPLTDGLTIKPSEINGLVLHTLEPLKAGIFLGETHIWETNRWTWIRTPLGGFINHSSNPNCFISTNIHYHHGQQRELYTTRPIEAGEELTVYYTVGYDDIV